MRCTVHTKKTTGEHTIDVCKEGWIAYQLEPLLEFAVLVEEQTCRVGHCARGVVGEGGTRVHIKLVPHRVANGPIEGRRLVLPVLPPLHVAFEPLVGDVLRRKRVVGAACVVGDLLEHTCKLLRSVDVKLAVLRVGRAPDVERYEAPVAEEAPRPAGFDVPTAAVETVILDATGEALFVLHASEDHGDLNTRVRC